MAYSDLGAKIKAKYPGQYDDLDDETLGQRVAEKHPGAYDDIIGVSAPVAAAAPQGPVAGPPKPTTSAKPAAKKSTFQNIADFSESANNSFFGGLGRTLGGLAKLVTPDSVDKKIDRVVNDPRVMPKRDTTAQRAGATFGAAEQFVAETVPTLLVGPTKPLTGLKGVLARAGSNAGVSGVTAAAKSGANGNTSGQQLKDALEAALLSGGLSAGAEGIAAGVKPVLRKGAEATYNRLFKTPVAQRDAGRELIGTGLMKRGLVGDEGQIAEQLRGRAATAKDTVTSLISDNAQKPVKVNSVLEILQQLRTQLDNTPGESTTAVDSVIDALTRTAKASRPGSQRLIEEAINGGDLQRARNIVANLPEGDAYKRSMTSLLDSLSAPKATGTVPTAGDADQVIPLQKAQELKTNLQKAVNNQFLRQNTSGATEAQKLAAQKLRAAIESAVPDVASPNKEQEFAIRAIKQLTRQESASPSMLRKIAEIIATGSGIATLNPTLPAIVAAERVASNPKVATRTAQAAYKASQKTLDPAKVKGANRLVAALIGRLSGN